MKPWWRAALAVENPLSVFLLAPNTYKEQLCSAIERRCDLEICESGESAVDCDPLSRFLISKANNYINHGKYLDLSGARTCHFRLWPYNLHVTLEIIQAPPMYTGRDPVDLQTQDRGHCSKICDALPAHCKPAFWTNSRGCLPRP